MRTHLNVSLPRSFQAQRQVWFGLLMRAGGATRWRDCMCVCVCVCVSVCAVLMREMQILTASVRAHRAASKPSLTLEPLGGIWRKPYICFTRPLETLKLTTSPHSLACHLVENWEKCSSILMWLVNLKNALFQTRFYNNRLKRSTHYLTI